MEKLGKIYEYKNHLVYKQKVISVEYISSGKKDNEIFNLYECKITFCNAEDTFLISQFKTFEEMNNEILNWASEKIDTELEKRNKERKRFFAIQAAKKKYDKNYKEEKYKEGYK